MYYHLIIQSHQESKTKQVHSVLFHKPNVRHFLCNCDCSLGVAHSCKVTPIGPIHDRVAGSTHRDPCGSAQTWCRPFFVLHVCNCVHTLEARAARTIRFVRYSTLRAQKGRGTILSLLLKGNWRLADGNAPMSSHTKVKTFRHMPFDHRSSSSSLASGQLRRVAPASSRVRNNRRSISTNNIYTNSYHSIKAWIAQS